MASLNTAQAQTITFAPAVVYTTGAGSVPRSLVVADVNADGKRDLLVANYAGSTVAVLLGSGTGTFQPGAAFSTGAGSMPNNLAVADINQDGKLDVLTANFGSHTAGVLLGNGNGTFQSVATYSTGALSYPTDIAAADLNGDGLADLVLANGNNTSSVLVGNGNGTFQPFGAFSTGSTSQPFGVAVADVSGDGRPDILLANHGRNTAGVVLQNSLGQLQPLVEYAAGPSGGTTDDIAVADVNGDGRPDLLTANACSGTAGVSLGNGNGTFQPYTAYAYTSGTGACLYGIAVADLNRDGRPDLLTANYGVGVGVLLGNGNGTFQPMSTYSSGPTTTTTYGTTYNVAAADVNGDGLPDLIAANSINNSVSVLLNTTILAARATLPGTSATLHPNPASTNTTLALAGLPATVTQVQATLLDATGRTVGQQQLAAAQGTGRVEVPTAGLATGLYVLRLTAYDALGQPSGSLPTQRLSVQ